MNLSAPRRDQWRGDFGGACDKQFLDVYGRPHDPPEGGGGGPRLRDAGRRPWRCRPRHRLRHDRWTAGSHRDQGRQAGDRLDQRAAHDPLTVYVFSTPVLCAPSGALFFGLRQRGTTRAVVWQSGEISGSEPPPAAPVIRQTGTRAARAFAAPGPRGAQHPSGASARPAAALAARDRAQISTRRAARRRRRPRAPSGSRMLANVASAGGPPAPPSLARLLACAPHSALGPRQRLAVARRAHWMPARRRLSAPAWRRASARGPYPKSALTSLLKLARGSLPRRASAFPPTSAPAFPPTSAPAFPPTSALASPLWPPAPLPTLGLLSLAISQLRSHPSLAVQPLSRRARAARCPAPETASSVGPRTFWP